MGAYAVIDITYDPKTLSRVVITSTTVGRHATPVTYIPLFRIWRRGLPFYRLAGAEKACSLKDGVYGSHWRWTFPLAECPVILLCTICDCYPRAIKSLEIFGPIKKVLTRRVQSASSRLARARTACGCLPSPLELSLHFHSAFVPQTQHIFSTPP